MAYVDTHRAVAPVPPDRAWARVERLGGDARFYGVPLLWRARLLPETVLPDRVLGGPGFALGGPGRPLRPGDVMDFWDVVEVHPGSRLRLRARSRLPGTAHLDVEVHAHGARSELVLRTTFEPDGLAGHAYWWGSVAAHTLVFATMTRRLVALVAEP